MFKKILHEPLVHFLFAGFLLFVYFKHYATDSDEQTIVVNKVKLLDFMQFQSKAFNQGVFEEKLEQFSAREKQQIIENYVQEEALYREALKLGLDQNDYVLKRRIIQKMEFLLDDFDERTLVINEDSLNAYFKQHQERYFQPARYTFTHIFFKENALDRATKFMQNSRHRQLTAAESLQYGDRFLYHRNYAEKTIDFLESQFGTTFTQELAQLEANRDAWQGPISSEYGQHWIKLTHKETDATPKLTTIYNRVKSDYLNFFKKRHKNQQIRKLVETYMVKEVW